MSHSESLRILLTDPHLRGGGQVRYLGNLASELVRLGHDVTIGCKANSVLVDTAASAQCSVLDRFRFKGGLRPRAWSHDLAIIKEHIRTQSPNIIHVSGSQDHWTCALGNRMLGRPICIVRTRHNTYKVHDALPNRILNLKWTDFQIVVCDVVRLNLARQRAFDPERMCSIHNGVDAKLFRPDDEQRQRIRAEFGYVHDELVCGMVARMVPAKGHEFLFKAVAKASRNIPQLRVVVLGQGGLEDDLKAMARDLGIETLVNFAGFRHDMAECTQAFDIGVQPSIDCDTSSFSLKEQMAAAKPVVTSDYGGLTEIVSDGVEGLVVPAGTVDPLAQAIERLAASPEMRTRMGEAGRERVLSEFTIEEFARRTVEAYRRAMTIHEQSRKN